jgi:hypothetical protein
MAGEKEERLECARQPELSGAGPTVTFSLPASFQGSVRTAGELNSIRARRCAPGFGWRARGEAVAWLIDSLPALSPSLGPGRRERVGDRDAGELGGSPHPRQRCLIRDSG